MYLVLKIDALIVVRLSVELFVGLMTERLLPAELGTRLLAEARVNA
jgi:hypothetical protein